MSYGFKKFTNYSAAIFLLLIAIIKIIMGIYYQTSFKNGLVVITAGAYGVILAIARFIYAKKLDTDERDQIYVYRNMAYLLMIVAIAFLVSNILAMDAPIADYGLVYDIIIAVVLFALFSFSLKGVFKHRSSNVITRAIKIVSFTSALLNLVIIEHIFEFQLNRFLGIELYKDFKMYFTFGVVGVIILLSIGMLVSSIIKVHKFRKERGMI